MKTKLNRDGKLVSLVCRYGTVDAFPCFMGTVPEGHLLFRTKIEVFLISIRTLTILFGW